MYKNLASKETNLNRIFKLLEYINTFFYFITLSKHTIWSEAFYFLHILQLHSGLPHSLMTLLKVCKFSINFRFFGKAFQICGPSDKRLFEPKVT